MDGQFVEGIIHASEEVSVGFKPQQTAFVEREMAFYEGVDAVGNIFCADGREET